MFLSRNADNCLGLTIAQRWNAKEIVKAIQQYVEGHVNESVERRNFRRHTQQPGESFDDFLVALRELAKTCKFCSDECTQKNIRDQIIEGLIDGDTVEELLQEKDLTLAKTITKCRGLEAAKRQWAEISGATPEAASERHIRTTPLPTPAQDVVASSTWAAEGNAQPTTWLAYNLTCHQCQQIGHLAKACRSRQPRQPPPQTPNHPSTIKQYSQHHPQRAYPTGQHIQTQELWGHRIDPHNPCAHFVPKWQCRNRNTT